MISGPARVHCTCAELADCEIWLLTSPCLVGSTHHKAFTACPFMVGDSVMIKPPSRNPCCIRLEARPCSWQPWRPSRVDIHTSNFRTGHLSPSTCSTFSSWPSAIRGRQVVHPYQDSGPDENAGQTPSDAPNGAEREAKEEVGPKRDAGVSSSHDISPANRSCTPVPTDVVERSGRTKLRTIHARKHHPHACHRTARALVRLRHLR